jgi:hypothetical protein
MLDGTTKNFYGLFCNLSPDSDFFLHNEILKRLRDEGHLFERLPADWTWCRAQRVQTIYTRFTPCRIKRVVG